MLSVNSFSGGLYFARAKTAGDTRRSADGLPTDKTEAEVIAENNMRGCEDNAEFTFRPEISASETEGGMRGARLSEEDYRSLTDYIKSHCGQLKTNPNAEVDPDGKIYAAAYVEGLVTRYKETEMAIREYYADAHRENLTFDAPSDHISEKYLCENSRYFKKEMPRSERLMAYHQERALLFGGSLALNDPYALAAKGGVPKFGDVEKYARQYAQSKIDALIRARKSEKISQSPLLVR